MYTIGPLVRSESFRQGSPCALNVGGVQSINDTAWWRTSDAVPAPSDIGVDECGRVHDHLNVGEASAHLCMRQDVGFGDPAWRSLVVVPHQSQLLHDGLEISAWVCPPRRDTHSSAWLEHPSESAQRLVQVGEEHHTEPTEDTVEGGIRKLKPLGIHNADTRPPSSTVGVLVRGLDHGFRQIDTNSFTLRPDALDNRKEHGTPTGRHVEHVLSRLDPHDLHETTPEVGKQSLRIEVCCPATEGSRRLRFARQGIVAHGASSCRVLKGHFGAPG